MAPDPLKGPQWDQLAQRAALLMVAALATGPQSKRGRSSHPGLPSAHQLSKRRNCHRAAVAVEATLSEVLLALSGTELELAQAIPLAMALGSATFGSSRGPPWDGGTTSSKDRQDDAAVLALVKADTEQILAALGQDLAVLRRA